MKSLSIAAALSLIAATCSLAWPQDPSPAGDERCRVGVYDSRGIAIAYAASKHNDAFVAEVRARMEEARRTGDERRVQEIEAQMRERQRQFHAMGFSRSDVSSLLEPIRGQLPAVADAAGVDVIVSKWDIDYLREGTKVVNVTEAVTALYAPNERTKTWVREIQGKDPLPPEEVRHDH